MILMSTDDVFRVYFLRSQKELISIITIIVINLRYYD